MILKQPEINAIADILMGSCLTLDEALEEVGADFMELQEDDFRNIKNLVNKCDTCDWWDDPSQFNEDYAGNICKGCSEE